MHRVYHVTKADMHREPVEVWRADLLNEEIRKLRIEVVRLKIKAGARLTMADLGFEDVDA